MKVLIAEDDKYMQDLLSLKLNLDEIDHDVASTVDEAIEKIKNDKWSLIVADIMFPEKSGIDIAHFLKESGSTIPLLFISAKNRALFIDENSDLLEKYPEIKNYQYLTKPFDLDTFVEKVLELIPEEKI